MNKICFLIFSIATMSACSADHSAPISVDLYHESNPLYIPNNPYTPTLLNYINVQATTDEVALNNIIINRGQCALSSRQKVTRTLKFGQSYQSVINCNIDQVREVSVTTNQGEFTFKF